MFKKEWIKKFWEEDSSDSSTTVPRDSPTDTGSSSTSYVFDGTLNQFVRPESSTTSEEDERVPR